MRKIHLSAQQEMHAVMLTKWLQELWYCSFIKINLIVVQVCQDDLVPIPIFLAVNNKNIYEWVLDLSGVHMLRMEESLTSSNRGAEIDVYLRKSP